VVAAPRFADYGYDEHAGTWESPEPDITATDRIWSDRDKVKRWDRTAFYVDKALDFLARHKGRPCFVNVWLDDPHTPWVPDAAAGKGAPTRANLKAVMEENDRQIGRLREGLRALGIERDALLIFASDNGPLPTLGGARSGGLRGSKLSLYEGGIRLPFLAVWPGTVPAGVTDDTTVLAAVDVFPTVCKLARAAPPENGSPDGEDRSAALLGTPQPERSRPLFWEYGRNDTSFAYPTTGNGARPGDRSPNLAVRDGRWKLLVNDDGRGAELYDLPSDPAEALNLAGAHPELTAALTRRVLEWRRSLP
jgi:arylsulfatase A-like enzyme